MDHSPVVDSLLSFDVTGVGTRTVSSAKLRLWVSAAATNAGTLWPTATGWSESSVTWNSAPAPIGTVPSASLGAVNAPKWLDVDVTSLVRKDGSHSLRISGGTATLLP